MTKVLTVDPKHPQPGAIDEAARILQSGGLVAFPTETVYGLGANALDADAVAKIFTAKGRPSHDPLIVHLPTADDLPRVARDIPALAYSLAAEFWPGPLTLVLPRQPHVPLAVSAGLETVAVRVPSHPVAQALIRAAGVPVAAPSANRFGHTSPTTAAHVLQDLYGRVDVVLDGGPANLGVESTVLDISVTPARILRPGGVTREQLTAILGEVTLLNERMHEEKGLPSPGLLAKHYAPRAEMLLFSGGAALAQMHTYLADLQAAGRTVGVMAADEDAEAFAAAGARVFHLGSASFLEEIAHNLYAAMRELDAAGVDVILCRDFGESGLGLAIRDRLSKAATRVIR
ncbi:MAG: L-threonylcarbamoyladenylate synthase [Anaerolineales bacterium]